MKKKTRLLFESLSHPTRLQLIELLAVRPRHDGELARLLKITEASLQHHLQHLRDIPGLLLTERQGPLEVHAIDRNVLAEALVDFGRSSGLDVHVQ